MSVFYDGNGNQITIDGGSGASAFGVTDYKLYTDNDGSARQAVLTYDGKRLYPVNMQDQRQDKIKVYDGGVMFALGDSYTAMGASYFTAFAERHGLVCDNRGVASSTIAGSTANAVGYQPFHERLDTAISEYQAAGGYTINGTAYTTADVKLVTFMGGANDWYTVDEAQGIDRLGDPTSEDKEQLHGACKYIFDKLLASFPNADIVVILQPCNAAKGNYAMWLKEGIVREMAEMYSLPICDCCFEWYNPSNPNDAATYWQSDNLHMTGAGNTAIFNKLEKTVNNLPFTRNE